MHGTLRRFMLDADLIHHEKAQTAHMKLTRAGLNTTSVCFGTGAPVLLETANLFMENRLGYLAWRHKSFATIEKEGF